MPVGQMTFVFSLCQRLERAIGSRNEAQIVAQEALRHALSRSKSLDIACMHIIYKGLPIAFSTRIGNQGDIILKLEESDMRLASREFGEDELRRAEDKARDRDRTELRPKKRSRS